MKILMVTGVYLPDTNGAVLQCKQLISHLDSYQDFDVLTSPSRNAEAPSSFDSRVHRIINYSSVAQTFKSTLKIFFLLKSNRYSIIHFHGFSRKVFIIASIGKIFGSKIILKCSSQGVDDVGTLASKGLAYRLILILIDGFVAPAPAFLGSGLKCMDSRLRLKLRLIPNGVDVAKFHPLSCASRLLYRAKKKIKKDEFVILSVGHFSKDKCLGDVLKAATICGERYGNITLILIGSRDPSHFEVSQEVLDEFQIFDAVSKPPMRLLYVSYTSEIERYFQISDLFILSSAREGMPNVLVEAMACGVPVIASKLPNITDWIIDDGIDGFLFSVGNIAELVLKIKLVKEGRSLSNRLGKAARKKILQNFSFDLLARRYLDYYLQLAS